MTHETTQWVPTHQIRVVEHDAVEFDEEELSIIRDIHGKIGGVLNKSEQAFIDMLATDGDPYGELVTWWRIALCYDIVTKDEPWHPDQKHQILKVLLGCTMMPRSQVILMNQGQALSREDIETVIAVYEKDPLKEAIDA